MNKLSNDSSTAQELIAAGREEGRKEEALRITRMALSQRFGNLEQHLIEALEQQDTDALEIIAFDTLNIEHLCARLRLHQETSLDSPKEEMRQPSNHARLSPRGGILRARSVASVQGNANGVQGAGPGRSVIHLWQPD